MPARRSHSVFVKAMPSTGKDGIVAAVSTCRCRHADGVVLTKLQFYSPIGPPGVADGVGGWRDYGVDPSQFSATLMRTCERLVKEGRFTPSNPVGILTSGYYELLQNKVPLLGEYTETQNHKQVMHYGTHTQSVVE